MDREYSEAPIISYWFVSFSNARLAIKMQIINVCSVVFQLRRRTFDTLKGGGRET